MDPPRAHYKTVHQNIFEIKSLLETYQMGVVCHLPTFVYTADLTKSIRRASLNEIIRSMEVAVELNASKAVLHPSIISGLGAFDLEDSKNTALQSLEKIYDKAIQLNLKICLENMFPRYLHGYEPWEFLRIFKMFPELKFTLDVGHANIQSPVKGGAISFISELKDTISHIHLSDNLGKRDDHLPIGKGNIDFKTILKALRNIGYQGTCTLEIFNPDRIYLQKGRERIAALWASVS